MTNTPKSAHTCWLSAAIIFICWLIARLYVYRLYWPAFHEVALQKDALLTLWYMPPAFIHEHLLDSLYYLRSKPPLPQAILGLLMKADSWPFSYPIDSFLLSGMTLIVAFLLRNILLHTGFGLNVSTAFSAIWCLSPSYLTVEINGFPSVFYEALPAFLIVISLWTFVRALQSNQSHHYWVFALSTCLIPMARSTMTFFFGIPILFATLFRSKIAKFIGLAALITQLAWAGKNYMIYNQFHLETASDMGINLLWVLWQSDKQGVFENYAIAQHPNNASTYKNLFSCLKNANQPCLDKAFPNAKEKDKTLANIGVITGDVAKTYGMGDSYLMSEVTAIIKPLYISFSLDNPAIILSMFKESYVRFWGEIYAQIPQITGLGQNQFLQTAAHIIEVYKYICVAVIHSITLPLVLYLFWQRLKGREWNYYSIVLLYSFSVVAYVALVSSYAAYGENTRYRIDVEPVVWLLPFLTFAWFRQQFNTASKNISSAQTDHA